MSIRLNYLRKSTSQLIWFSFWKHFSQPKNILNGKNIVERVHWSVASILVCHQWTYRHPLFITHCTYWLNFLSFRLIIITTSIPSMRHSIPTANVASTYQYFYFDRYIESNDRIIIIPLLFAAKCVWWSIDDLQMSTSKRAAFNDFEDDKCLRQFFTKPTIQCIYI